MNALHLLWIIPVVFMAGYITCGLLCANGPDEKRKPVVHCAECKYHDTIACTEGRVWCKNLVKYAKKDWFCADGERKADNG